jgi:CoA:oxalate CoA-transferase
MLRRLMARADVMIQNFRPGVIERQGFGYDDVKRDQPGIVYGSISGYGEDGPWRGLPGQDLLAQARSGLMWLTGSRATTRRCRWALRWPTCWRETALAQGILAALVGRGMHGRGAHVQTSLLEAMIDFQFEVLTTHLNDGRRVPVRARSTARMPIWARPMGSTGPPTDTLRWR